MPAPQFEGPADGSPRAQVTAVELLVPLIRSRYLILASAFAAGVLALLLGMSDEPTYTSEMSFITEGGASSNPRGLAAAAQLGLEVPVADPSTSPQFYLELLDSRALLSPLLTDTFRVTAEFEGEMEVREGTLAEILRVEEEDPDAVRAELLDWLGGAISPAQGRAGIVKVEITTAWPELSQQLGDQLLEHINVFNLHTRRTRAASERRFVEAQLAEAEQSLRQGEERLERFLEQNRRYEASPSLVFEFERLQRRVNMDQQRVTSLTMAAEEARIAELRDIPVITVFEEPTRPLDPDPAGSLRLRLLIGLFAGALLGGVLGFGREFLRYRMSEDRPAMRQLRAEWNRALNDLRFWNRGGKRPRRQERLTERSAEAAESARATRPAHEQM